jgi:hypothetical protein
MPGHRLLSDDESAYSSIENWPQIRIKTIKIGILMVRPSQHWIDSDVENGAPHLKRDDWQCQPVPGLHSCFDICFNQQVVPDEHCALVGQHELCFVE